MELAVVALDYDGTIGRAVYIGHAPPQILLDELKRVQIPFQIGECVIETEARHAPPQRSMPFVDWSCRSCWNSIETG